MVVEKFSFCQDYVGKNIKLKVDCTRRSAFCNEHGRYEYTTYDYLVIFNAVTGFKYKEMRDFYLIKRFLINKNIIKGA